MLKIKNSFWIDENYGMNKILLEQKSIEELKEFFSSLDEEKKLAKFDIDLVLKSEFIAIERVGNKVAGVIGLWRTSKFFPALFLVVKKCYQGKNIGNKLVRKEIEFARVHYDFIILNTFDSGKYNAAIHLYKKYGFRVFLKRKSRIWMCVAFNSRGKIICRFLPLIFSVKNLIRPRKIIRKILGKHNY
jgi:GNAT superfamily N-acetyltransferase